MRACSRRSVWLTAVFCTVFAGSAFAASVSFKSGTTPPIALNPPITYYAEPSGVCAAPFGTPFSAADFAAADAGPTAWSVPAYGAWGAQLWCDPTAGWISTGPNWPTVSALYSIPFYVDLPQPCCIQHATLDLCWMADDVIGDSGFGGPNPLGVYLNGVGLPIAGGNYATATRVIVDITQYLQCGQNRLYIYNRDLGCSVSGLNFSAVVQYVECEPTPAPQKSWGAIRAMYR